MCACARTRGKKPTFKMSRYGTGHVRDAISETHTQNTRNARFYTGIYSVFITFINKTYMILIDTCFLGVYAVLFLFLLDKLLLIYLNEKFCTHTQKI